MRIWEAPELRTIYLGMDQLRPERLESNVKAKPVQGQEGSSGFYQAIDEEVIKTNVMRGFANPTALMIGPGVNGFDPALNRCYPYDNPRSRSRGRISERAKRAQQLGGDERQGFFDMACLTMAAIRTRVSIS